MSKPRAFFYWNYFDNDSKRMYRFLHKDESDFIEGAENICEVFLHRRHIKFDSSDQIYVDIAQCDILLFFTHGEADAILKRAYGNPLFKNQYTLIDLENVNLFSGKKVISICCDSAKLLGPESIVQGCKVFVGFREAIFYDLGKSTLRPLVYEAYSEAFARALKYAMKERVSADAFAKRLHASITQSITDKVLSGLDRGSLSLSELSEYYRGIDSITVLGESQEPLFT